MLMTDSTRKAVQDLGDQVRAAQEFNKKFSVAQMPQSHEYNAGFIAGVAHLSALLCETIPTETLRREFLKDCGFDGEQDIGD